MIAPEDMAAIHKAAFTQSRAWSAEEFASLLAHPSVFACGDSRAFALVRVVADEAELLTIATHPLFQRQGHARAVMTAWQEEATKRGATRGFLEVASDNAAARQLYQACGYSQTGLRQAYYPREGARAADAVIMARDLTQG